MIRSMSSRRLAVVGAALAALAAPLAAQDGPTVTVSGVGYLHYRYQLGTDSSLTPPAHANNFDVDRTYVTIAGKLGDGLSTRITTDVDGRKAAGNQLTLRLKYAYLAWKPEGSALTYKFGQIQTPYIDFEEALWGYRMQGPIAMDRIGYLTSSDIGLSVDGSWQRDAVNLTAGVYNGEGYSKAPGDQHKDVAARLSIRLAATDATGKTGGLRLTGFAQVGRSNGGGTRQRFLGLLSYQTRAITLGAEYAVTKDSTAADSPETAGRVISAFAVYNLPASPLAVIGRVDRWDPNTDVTPDGPDLASGEQTRVIGGVSYQLNPNVRLLLDADLASLTHGSPNNASTPRGGRSSSTPNSRSDHHVSRGDPHVGRCTQLRARPVRRPLVRRARGRRLRQWRRGRPAGGAHRRGRHLPEPDLQQVVRRLQQQTGVQINYQSIGSGGGIRQYTEGTVDFGATDGPMTDQQIAAVKGKVLHIPTVLGAVVLTYNLPALGDSAQARRRRPSPTSSWARSPSGTTPGSWPSTRA